VSIVTDAEATSSSVTIYHKLPVSEQLTAGAYRRSLVEQLYNAMLNARLQELAQQRDPPFLGAGSSAGRLLRTAEGYLIGAGVADGGIERGLEAVVTEAERVARHGFTETELERARTNVLRSFEMAYAERDKSNSSTYASEYVRAFLEQEAIPGIAVEYQIAQQFIPDITLDEVNALVSEWMTERNRVVVAQAPEKPDVPVPTEEAMLAVFDAVEAKQIEPYEDVVVAGSLVPQPPTPGTIVTEERHDAVNTVEWTLSNGVRVFLKETDFKDDEILFTASSPGGFSLLPDEDVITGMLAAVAVQEGGLGDLSLVDLRRALTGKAASVQASIGETSEGLAGSASPSDIRTLFELIYLRFTSPREDPDAFEALRSRFQAQLANRSADPQTAFYDTLNTTLAQHHPRAPLLTSATLDEWQLDESMAFYRDRFADASDFTFVFVGNFDADSVRPLVLEYLGGLPDADREEDARDAGIRPPSGVIEKVVRKGIEPKSQTAIVFTGPFEYTRPNRHVIGSLRDALEIELRDALREELGGTYGVEVSQSTDYEPWENYMFTIAFSASPDRLEELTDVAFQHIERVKAEGLSASTLDRIKEIQRRTHETRIEENGYWVGQLMYAAELGENPEAFQVYPSLIDGLTADMIRDAANEYLRQDNYVRVSLYPEQRS
ncbi:MAG: insulinase family protein, partial [Longimicrobiales bacterium]